MKYDNILMNFEFEGLKIVYIINQIRDLTNSYDMPWSRSQWLFLEKNIVIALEPSFMDRF